ncbi:Salicylate carboxymethyltransferase [Linum perenne]
MKTLAIADLGCASGPNTLLAISNLIKTIITISSNLNWEICPEFQVFLNDLPGNDFNSIFTSLEQFRSQLKEETAPCGELPLIFFNGVPGSFHGRLFPVESLHFVHSSYSLHWLSQVPEGVEEANKGRISVSSGSDPSVVEAYRGQFEGDFVRFLRCRGLEMVKGGRMVLTLQGRRSEEFSVCCDVWQFLSIALNQLAFEGTIDMKKLDSFNIPSYMPCPNEIELAVEKDGSFVIECIEIKEMSLDPYEAQNNGGHNVAKYMRAVAEPLLVRHFGSDASFIDAVFRRYSVIVSESMAAVKTNFVHLSVSLTKP